MFPTTIHLANDTTQTNFTIYERQQSKISTTIGTTEELSSKTTITVLPNQPYLTTPDLCDLNSTKSSWNDIVILLEYTQAVGEQGIISVNLYYIISLKL